MVSYILILAVIVWGLSYLTMIFCWHWEIGIWTKFGEADNLNNIIYKKGLLWGYWYDFPSETDKRMLLFLDIFRVWCPFFYAFAGMILTVFLFYRKRLAYPLSILKESVEKIGQNDLDFHITYDSRDELGVLCDSVENMRLELVRDKEEMWRLIERQKELNAAFAHDLRTPLTVLRGYTDFLARYIPEGRLSQEKLQNTLKLMTEHLSRLEEYSRTMKGIRSIEEVPFSPEQMTLQHLQGKIEEVIFALNQAGDVTILYAGNVPGTLSAKLWVDEGMVLEVLENILSNAIRYAHTQIEVLSDYEETQQELLLTVRDDGPGFSSEQLETAVLPYHKEYKASSQDEHFGIGLHICSELCKKHGGILSAANSIQGGAVLTASFSVKESC